MSFSLRTLSLLSLVLVLNGCALGTRGRGPATENIAIGSCHPTPCVNVTIETLSNLPEGFSSEAKDAIYAQVDRALYLPIDDDSGEVSRSRFIDSVRAQYEDYLKVKDAEVVVDWNVTRAASILFANESLVSVRVKSVGYLGGAHGFNDETLFVFDGKTGRALGWSDLISSSSRPLFLKAAEAEFKRARGLRTDQSLTDVGFSFENGASFGLPSNFALTDKGIVCHYNPYEVGPYVMGPTDFVVPMDVVGPALNSGETALQGLSTGDKRLL